MSRLFGFFLVFALFTFGLVGVKTASAQDIDYSVGTVRQVLEQREFNFDGTTFYSQKLLVENQDGRQSETEYGSEFQPLSESQLMNPGSQIILADMEGDAVGDLEAESQVVIADNYRIPILLWLAVGFFMIVLVVAGVKGVFSIAGMFLNLVVLSIIVVPQILAGGNPLLITLGAALIIAIITVYVSHGFKASSHIALLSMLTTLVGVTLLSYWFVELANLTGLGTEEAGFLQVGETAKINLQGLLLSGIMLGALGVLDDITVSQVATVFEIKRANKKLPFHELYERGMRVGRDHVASLVNTLVLAYAGANLPLFLLFYMGAQTPTWVNINNQLIAEEIVRTLMGSIGLVAAVPLTTALAAYWVSRKGFVLDEAKDSHSHPH